MRTTTKLRMLRYHLSHTAAVRRPRPGGLGAIGDSLTAGQGNPSWWLLPENSWVTHAVLAGVPYSYNAAVGEQVTEQVVGQLPEVLRHRPSMVTVLAGTNDVAFSLPLDRPVTLMAGVVERCQQEGVRPILATLLPHMPAPPGRDQAQVQCNIDGLSERVRALAAETGAGLIDFHQALAEVPDWRERYTWDGLHPNALGARRMAEVALPVLREAATARA